MSHQVIEVEGISKSYQIGSGGSATLGGMARQLVHWPYRKLRGLPIPPLIRNRETFWPLKDVSFFVNSGEVVGIIGSNGAGKSTLLKVLSRIISPTSGGATIRGRVSSLLEVGTGFNANLSGRENIFLNASLHGLTRKAIVAKLDEIVEFSGVAKFIDTPVKHYSSGMYSRLAFSVAAHLDPDVLFVDEVLAVGDLAFQQKCLNRFSEMVSGDRTVLFVSHNLSAISNTCTKVLWLDQGRVRFFGDTETGIASYYQAMIPAQSQSLGSRHDRTGTGDFHFTEISFYDAALRPCNEVVSGQALVIGLRYTCTPEKIGNIRDMNLAIVFKNDKGQRLFGMPSEVLPNLVPSTVGSSGEILFSINSLPLLPGIYDLDLGCIINRLTMDKIVSAKRIVINDADYFGSGRLPPQQMGDMLVKFNIEFSDGKNTSSYD